MAPAIAAPRMGAVEIPQAPLRAKVTAVQSAASSAMQSNARKTVASIATVLIALFMMKLAATCASKDKRPQARQSGVTRALCAEELLKCAKLGICGAARKCTEGRVKRGRSHSAC